MGKRSVLQALRNSSVGYVVCTHGAPTLKTLASAICLALVLVDILINNWELNDLIGNARTLFTPVLNVASQADLTDAFTFADGASLETLSSVGLFMVNYTLKSIHASHDNVYVLTANTYSIDSPVNDICGMLAQSYRLSNDSAVGSSVRLGVVDDGIRYVRGVALTNFFGGVASPPPEESDHDTLISHGYTPSRIDADMRLTTPVKVPPQGGVVFSNVSMYRFYARAQCTGCDPAVELGLDVCTIATSYNASARELVVGSSRAAPEQHHVLGMMLERSAVTVGSLYVRGFCVLFVLAAFTTSHKTVRWTDSVTLSSWYKKALYMVAPAQYRYQCRAVEFSYFCFNSDIFVVGYVVAVLLDEKACHLYSRSLFRWNHSTANSWTSWFVVLRIVAMNNRWVWLNCFLVKLLKAIANVLSTARYTGRNYLVGYLNFSTITYVYVAGVPLVYRNNLIDYGNSDTVTLTSSVQPLDGISVDFFDSVLMRGYPGMVFVMCINLLAVLTIDAVVNWKWRRQVANNSLGRQHIYNSTSILMDVGYAFVDWPDFKGQAIVIPVRSLCTMQWFLTCHTLCFGLPEHPSNIRGMASKAGSAPSQVAPSKRRSTESSGDIPSSNTTTGDDFFMVTQDQDGYIHIFNSRKTEMQAVSMEVKAQANARYLLV